MKMNHVVILVTAVFVTSGCSPMPKVSYVGKPDCVGNAKKIMVTATPNDFSLKPPNLCVKNGDTVTVQVTGPGAGEVRVSGKPGAEWIKGDNSSNKNAFTFTVPSAEIAEPDETYFYNVIVQGYGLIDPMLTIEK